MTPILYTTHCPKCKVLEQKLKLANIGYQVIEDVAIMQEKGLMSVPALEVNGQMMNFMTAVKWIGEQTV